MIPGVCRDLCGGGDSVVLGLSPKRRDLGSGGASAEFGLNREFGHAETQHHVSGSSPFPEDCDLRSTPELAAQDISSHFVRLHRSHFVVGRSRCASRALLFASTCVAPVAAAPDMRLLVVRIVATLVPVTLCTCLSLAGCLDVVCWNVVSHWAQVFPFQ